MQIEEIAIKENDTLWMLFGESWYDYFYSSLNDDLRIIRPEPTSIQPGDIIKASVFGDIPPGKNKHKAIIIGNDFMGDDISSTPIIKYFKELGYITYRATTPKWFPLLSDLPFVDKFCELSNNEIKNVMENGDILISTWSHQPGIKNQISVKNKIHSKISVDPNQVLSHAQEFMERLGISLLTNDPTTYCTFPKISQKLNKRVIPIATGSQFSRLRAFHPKAVLTIYDRLKKEGYIPIIMCSDYEKPLYDNPEHFVTEFKNKSNIFVCDFEKSEILQEALNIVKECSFFVSPDSGLIHARHVTKRPQIVPIDSMNKVGEIKSIITNYDGLYEIPHSLCLTTFKDGSGKVNEECMESILQAVKGNIYKPATKNFPRKLKSITIKSGDFLYKLFGDRWREIYFSKINEEFRQKNPNPHLLSPGSTIYSEERNLLVTIADKKYLSYAKNVFSSAFVNGGWTDDMMLLACNLKYGDPDLDWFKENSIIIEHVNDIKNPMFAKLKLFMTEFRQWAHIVYLDADTFVTGRLDNIVKDGFWAVSDYPMNSLKHYGIDSNNPSINAGVLSFSTDIITDNTYKELNNIPNPDKLFYDQGLFNIYFYKTMNYLPEIYNTFVCHTLSCKHKIDIESIVLHFAACLGAIPYYQYEIKEVIHKFENKITNNIKVLTPEEEKEKSESLKFLPEVIETTIKRGDTLNDLFLNHWESVYYAPYNKKFREKSPDPNLIYPGDIIKCAPWHIIDPMNPIRDINIPAGDIITHLFDKNQTLMGAEIGCHFGFTSKMLLKWFPNLTLYMVDPWGINNVEYSSDKHHVVYPREDKKEFWDKIYEIAMCKIEFAKDRAKILRGKSETECLKVEDESLDFVFIDGNHSKKNTYEDIVMWNKKVKKNGYIVGHDYNLDTVRDAIDEYVANNNIKLEMGNWGSEGCLSWFFRK